MNQKDRFKNLISFVQTARFGSFSAAAQAFDLTPAALSKNVAMLEQSLGVRLFNRTTRSLSLTEEGRHFLTQAALALAILDTAADDIQPHADDGIHGTVRLTSPSVMGRNALLPLVSKLLADYPHLNIDMSLDDHVIDFVKEGYDLALRVGFPSDSALIARQLGTIRTCLVAAPDYITRHGKPKNQAALGEHRILMQRFPSGKMQAWQFKHSDGINSFTPKQARLLLNDPEALRHAAMSGLGIAQLPEYLVQPFIEKGELTHLHLPDYQPHTFQITLQYPHRALQPKRVQQVQAYLLANWTVGRE
ncbi:MAG: LysR family transcriptional regulator [Neisseria sp.]|nr:LysR family transcriptional regulator [Neisseria sp.]